MAAPFLDITTKVDDAGNEKGLLGLAFDPDFVSNGYLYINYTYQPVSGLDRTRVSRFKVSSDDVNVADGSSEFIIIEVKQDYANHNGGDVHFGPDGYLYIGMGDGGGGGDQNKRAQTLSATGSQRASRLYQIKSVLDSGARIAFGSDWSVSTANPYEEMEVAVTRMDPNNDQDSVFIPEERIGVDAAIAAFTINAAFTNHLEEQTGSIETGKSADLVVLNQNLFEIAPTTISDTKALVTLFEGKTVHGDLSEL